MGPMIFDVITLGSTARVTLEYWKWVQALEAKVTANESNSTSGPGSGTAPVETKVSSDNSSITTAENSARSDLESNSTSGSGSETAPVETKVSSDNSSLTTAENSLRSDLEMGAADGDVLLVN